MLAADFHYDLPEGAIAQAAIEPRDTSRLLVTSTEADHAFYELPELLNRGDLLVVNRTRVRAARFTGTKSTGGAVEVLLLRPVGPGRWEALLRPSRRVRPGTEILIGEAKVTILTMPERGLATLELSVEGDAESWIEESGQVPLPPYFRGRLDDPDRYQTIFASSTGSAAAPTAALHFTDRVLGGLAEGGVQVTEVELDIGLDTFRPMAEGPIGDHEMHSERFTIPVAAAEAIAATRERSGRVIAVGTTVMRTLETGAVSGGRVAGGEGHSELFITPGYRRRVVDALLTNFHAPGTTLVVLIAALLGPRWRRLYESALERDYRFLSFGDAMFIDDPVGGPVIP
ncbi:MAG: tRNA preQ1(34) S-adenosylmethionine ribosyltransferase-isomerase QueA [Acidimicrobiia bacterium]|nr:tRNA preQ1(34) S-adenosylmethionine ribosyltransferase-isomerase QueA [Acidimicrobiia bacterium]